MPVENPTQLKSRFQPGTKVADVDIYALIDSMRNAGQLVPAADINGLEDVVPNVVKDVFTGTLSEIRGLTSAKAFKTVVSTDKGAGMWFYDPTDKTSPDNTGTVIVNALGDRYKRLFKPDAKSFGAVGDGVTDDTANIQKYVDYVAGVGGGDVIIPAGFYFIQGTIYINKPVATPMTIKGINPLSKDRGADARGTAFVKKNAGDIFRVNLKEDGTPLVNSGTYQLNVSFDGLSFEGSETEEVYAIRIYRTRGKYTNLGFVLCAGATFQNETRPDGYVGTWDNYCDQSDYDNITMMYMTKYGIWACAADATRFNNIRYEYPKAGAITGALRIHSAYGFTVSNILHSNGNNEFLQKDNSYGVWIKESGNFTAHGLQSELGRTNELNNFEAQLFLDRCYGFNVSGVGDKFRSKDIIRMQGCRNGHIGEGVSRSRKVAGYYDIRDNPTFRSTKITYAPFRCENSPEDGGPGAAVREMLLNFTPDANFGYFETYQKIRAEIDVVDRSKVNIDNWIRVTPNYANSPNVALSAIGLYILGEISQDTTFSIPASADNGNKRFVIKNVNTSSFKWILAGAIRDTEDKPTNEFPNGSVTELAASPDAAVMPIFWYMLQREVTYIDAAKVLRPYIFAANNADYTISRRNSISQLPTIFANQIVNLPAAPGEVRAETLINRNTGAFKWLFSAPVLDTWGNPITEVPANSVCVILWNKTNWRIFEQTTSQISANAVLDFPSIPAGSESAALTINLPGVGVWDHVLLASPNIPGVVYKSFVNTPGVVSIVAANFTGAAVDPASGIFKVTRVA